MDRYKEIDFMKCIEIIFVVVHLPIHSELNRIIYSFLQQIFWRSL